MTRTPLAHEESWLQLPWLANGRLTLEERAEVEAHVRGCPECARELATQRSLQGLLSAPDTVSYAAAPSFRKLLQRIDAAPAAAADSAAPKPRHRLAPHAWRPPGLAWAATFVLTVSLGLMVATTYRWSQPAYRVTTTAAAPASAVLHVAFERSLPVGEVGEVLQRAGARVVEGEGGSGVFGVVPATANGPVDRAQLAALAARLHRDPRVRWIEPLAGDAPAARDP
ncbi:MAG: zf-HC2 domain-containing protein [Gammaproteobacteria bacterium]|nr:zf-HC2 domain-containing protein [Gammaproteobacteria bacterium]MBV9698102.1 zf-HC2 domain-containing protein [Gammaproteobacteria bacterium]